MTTTSSYASTQTVEHIAALVTEVRPAWDPWLVRSVLLSYRDQVAAADLAVAAIRAARDERLPTPKAIGWRGGHWDGLETRPVTAEPTARCDVCGRTEPKCYSTRVGVDDDHVFVAVRR